MSKEKWKPPKHQWKPVYFFQSKGESIHLYQQSSITLKRLLGDNGVLLYPSHPTLAPYHNEPLFRPLNFTYTAIFNALGFPVTQVPLGLAPNGLPLGIQVSFSFSYIIYLSVNITNCRPCFLQSVAFFSPHQSIDDQF